MSNFKSAVRVGKALRKKGGFTLIEILVVIVIIAILAGTVGPAVFKNVGAAQSSVAKDQITALAAALDSYRLDNGHYPTTQQGLDALINMPTIDPPSNWRGPYLTSTVVPLDPWKVAFYYIAPGEINPTRFDLYSLGKDGQPGGEDVDLDNADITSWN